MKRLAREQEHLDGVPLSSSFSPCALLLEKTAFRERHIHAGWAQARPTCRHPPRGTPVSNGKREKWGRLSRTSPQGVSEGKGKRAEKVRRTVGMTFSVLLSRVPPSLKKGGCAACVFLRTEQAGACGNRDKRQPSSEGLRKPCPGLRVAAPRTSPAVRRKLKGR